MKTVSIEELTISASSIIKGKTVESFMKVTSNSQGKWSLDLDPIIIHVRPLDSYKQNSVMEVLCEHYIYHFDLTI